MTLGDWLDFFKRYKDIKIFHLYHLGLLTKMNMQSLKVSLNRLSKKGVVQRMCRGYYANPFNLPKLEEISGVIYIPSYISLEWALSRWGILSQIPQVLTCITTKLPRTFSTAFGEIEYRQIKKGYFWGFVQDGSYFIATPEKALLDYLYLKKEKDIKKAVYELDLKDLDWNKITAFSKKMRINLPADLDRL